MVLNGPSVFVISYDGGGQCLGRNVWIHCDEMYRQEQFVIVMHCDEMYRRLEYV